MIRLRFIRALTMERKLEFNDTGQVRMCSLLSFMVLIQV